MPCADTRTCYSDVPPRSAALDSAAQQRALDALFLAAPVRGEVQPWVWLLRAVADTNQLDSVHDCICYLVSMPAHTLGIHMHLISSVAFPNKAIKMLSIFAQAPTQLHCECVLSYQLCRRKAALNCCHFSEGNTGAQGMVEML